MITMNRPIRISMALACVFVASVVASNQPSGAGHDEAQEMVRECILRVQSAALSKGGMDAVDHVNDFSDCMTDYLAGAFMRKEHELHREMSLNREVAFHSENFTCKDLDRETSEPQLMTQWQHYERLRNETIHRTYEVQVHLDRPASKIHLIPNFATQEECDAMIEAGREGLAPATVADGIGGKTVNKVRKANQGNIIFHLDDEDQTIPNVYRRIYAYNNHVTGLALDFAGQETLNSIEYIGRGMDDTNPDHYKPHCDGRCNGKEHMEGNRVATMIIYTRAPEVGGHTNFGRANVHIKPRVGDAIFFSYLDPETSLHDTGLTQHSACPVYEGTKNIVTHWMRLGVSFEKPFFDFNSLGKYDPIKRPEAEEAALLANRQENSSLAFDTSDTYQSGILDQSNQVAFTSMDSQKRQI